MEKTFGIIPSSNGPLLFIGGLSLFLLLLIALFVFIGYSAKSARFEVSDQGLHIKGAIYGRFIPKEEIIAERAAVIDLNVSQQYKPGKRTNGIGLPGYLEGWFRLGNGEKALLFMTDKSSVVYLPTSKGYSVLLSAQDAPGFYEAIKAWR